MIMQGTSNLIKTSLRKYKQILDKSLIYNRAMEEREENSQQLQQHLKVKDPLLKALKKFGDEADKELNNKQLGKAILLIGEQKTGKTCLLYHLKQAEFISSKDEGGKRILTLKSANDINICRPKCKGWENSESVLPYFTFDKSVCIIEVPDLTTSFSPQHKTLSYLSTSYLLSKFSSYHLVLVFSPQQYDTGVTLSEKIKLLNQIFGLSKNDYNLAQYISIVLTNAEVDSDEQEVQFRQITGDINSQAKDQEYESPMRSINDGVENRLYSFYIEPTSEEGMQMLDSIKATETSFVSSTEWHIPLSQELEQKQKVQQVELSQFRSCLMNLADLLIGINGSVAESPKKKKKKLESKTQFHLFVSKDRQLIEKYINSYDKIFKQMLGVLASNKIKDQSQTEAKQAKHSSTIKFIKDLGSTTHELINALPAEAHTQFSEQIKQFSSHFQIVKLLIYGLPMNEELMNKIVLEALEHKAFNSDEIKSLVKICGEEDLGTKNLQANLKSKKNIVQKAKQSKKVQKKSYQTLLKEYQQKSIQQVILLPNKILKFDILHRELAKRIESLEGEQSQKQQGNKRNYYEERILVRQICKILQSYKLYQEAISFFMVIPDFNRIEQLLDQAYSQDPVHNIADYSMPFSSELPRRFLEKLREFTADNMRDYLATKCNNFLINKFGAPLGYLRQQQKQYTNSIIRSYCRRQKAFKLDCKKGGTFMNYKNVNYGDDILSEHFRTRTVKKVIGELQYCNTKNQHPEQQLSAYEFLAKDFQI